jgi:hypothetical protein
MNPQEQINDPDRRSPSLPASRLPTDALKAPQILTTHDTFTVCDGSEQLHSKLIEDRAAIIKGSDGTTVGLVVDGVGEAYVSPESPGGVYGGRD